MHHTDRNNLTDEELRELQRKEALSDSEEYDIQDRTYNDGPLTRQYILDETIVGGSELVDEEKKKAAPPILVVEDESEEDDILIVSDEDPIEEKPTNDITTEEAVVDHKESEQENKNIRYLKPVLKESEKDYIDRNTALAECDENTAPVAVNKHEKRKKTKEHRGIPPWVKCAGMFLGFILLFIICILLYSYITGYITEKQVLSDEKRAYIELANKTNEIVLNEDDICRDFVSITENLMLGIVTADEYRDSVNLLSDRIDVELNSIATYEIVNPEDSQIKAAIIDYLKNTKAIVDLYSQSDLSEDELKLSILKDLNQHLINRNLRHSNLVALIYEQANVHNIDADQKDQIVMFDIEKP